MFAGMTEHDGARFEGATWHRLATDARGTDGALVAFDRRTERIVEVGTHDVFICAVEARGRHGTRWADLLRARLSPVIYEG